MVKSIRTKRLLRTFWIPALAAVVVVVGLTGLAHARSAETQSPNYSGSIQVGQQDQNKPEANDGVGETKGNADEAKESADLAPLAKITENEAVDAAKTAHPGYDVKNTTLENENGSVVYGVEMSGQSGKSLDVKVDAGDAKVLASENDSEDGEN